MSETEKPHEDELEFYADGEVSSLDAKVPMWLKWSYITSFIIGSITLYLFWNGSHGFLDRGYWNQLQKAANTTFPYINADK